LTIPYEREAPPDIVDAINRCLSVYGPDNVAILSNSVGSREDKGFEEAMKVEDTLGISVIRHMLKKPEVKEDIYLHFGLDPDVQVSDIALVGDRILADTVMGNSHGYFTILTKPINIKPENFMVKLMRQVEQHVLPLVSPGTPERHPV
jgi:phosphatidylglycerophosphatase GEP4